MWQWSDPDALTSPPLSSSESSPTDISHDDEKSQNQHRGNELNVGTRKPRDHEIVGHQIEDGYHIAYEGNKPPEVLPNLIVESAYQPPEECANHRRCNPRDVDYCRMKQHFDPSRNRAFEYSPSDCLQDDVNKDFPKANELVPGAYLGEAGSNPNDASDHETEQIEEHVR